MIRMRDICVSFRSERQEKIFGVSRTQVLFNVSLSIPKGSCLGILGESGSGKSTLGRVICGLLKPDSGEYLLEGKNVYASRDGSTNPNYDSFILRFIFELNITLNPEFDTSSLLCEILKKANYWNDDNQGFESVFYYFISDIIYALKKFHNQELKEELSKSIIKHSIKDNFNSMDSLYHLTETINQIMLDEFLSDISIYISNNNFTELRNWNLSSMLNKCKDLNTNKMITWYKSNPNHVSLIFLLSSLPLFEDSTEESFSNEILFLLNEIRIFSDLDFLDMRLNTYTSNGEDIMCSRKKAVEKLISNKNELIQKWAIEEKSKIERNQEREKEMLGHFFKKQDYSILENN